MGGSQATRSSFATFRFQFMSIFEQPDASETLYGSGDSAPFPMEIHGNARVRTARLGIQSSIGRFHSMLL